MAEKEEEKLGSESEKLSEKKIPVFTVFKNNSILKNIFVLDTTPSSISESDSTDEEVITIGRHPDCSITLDHPSISRFHLRLHSKPSSLQLSLVDLSSVHGTWVSGKKIEPGVQVELNEGDTVRLGGSSRLYMLHWVPISRAYDLSDPFVPPMDVLMPMKEIEVASQDDDCCSSVETNQFQSLCCNSEGLDSLISVENMRTSPSAPPPPVDTSSYNKEEEHGQNEISVLSPGQLLERSVIAETVVQQSNKANDDHKALLEVLPGIADANNAGIDNTDDLSGAVHERDDISSFSAGKLPMESVAEVENQQSEKANENQQALSRVLTGIANPDSPGIIHSKNPPREENEVSGFSSGPLLKESDVAEVEARQFDKENKNPQTSSRVLTGKTNADRPSVNHNENLTKEENEEYEISGFSSGLILNESAAEIEDQLCDKENESRQALVSVLTFTADANSPIPTDVNSLDFFNSSLSNEDEQILCASEMDHEQCMPSSGCHTPCSDAILESKDELLCDEQNRDPEYFSATGVDGRQSLNITSGKADQEINWSEDLKYSLSGEGGCIVVGKRSEAVDNQSSLEGTNEQKEIPGIISGALNIDCMKLSLHPQNIPTDDDCYLSAETNQSHSLCCSWESLDWLVSGNDMRMGPSAPPLPEPVDTPCYNKEEEHRQKEISLLSPGQLQKEMVVAEIEIQQSDKANEGPQALFKVLPGIGNADNAIIDDTKNMSGEEHKQNDISGFCSGRILKESVVAGIDQQCEKANENPQALSGVLTGIPNPDRLTIDHNDNHLMEENEISGISSGPLLKESDVTEIEMQQPDVENQKRQALSTVLTGIENANSPRAKSDKNLSGVEHEQNETFGFSSTLLLKESIEIEYQQSDEENENRQDPAKVLTGIANANSPVVDNSENLSGEDPEEYEISGFSSGLILKDYAEIEDQLYDKENESRQALVSVLTCMADANSPIPTDHNVNLLDSFNTSLFDEDAEIICASEMDHEQHMPTSDCHTPSSNAILELKNELFRDEEDHNLEYFSSTGVHATLSLQNTLGKSDQEVNWSEDPKYSLSGDDGLIVVGERSEAVNNVSSLEGNNEQKEISGISSALLKIDSLNLSLCSQNTPMVTCIEQLGEKNKMVQTFATNVSQSNETDILAMRLEQISDPPDILSRGEIPTRVDIQNGKQDVDSTGNTPDTEIKQLYKENMEYEPISETLISTVEGYAEEIFTPEKENFTPNTFQRRSTKKTNKLEERKNSEHLSLSPSNNSASGNIVQDEELLLCPDKENHTPKDLQERIVRPASKNRASLNIEVAAKNRVSRVPFQSLLSDSSSKNYPNSDTIIRNSTTVKNAQRKNTDAGDNKRWIMVADTNSLLNKVSRKALQLLQGLKGTRLIIPRIVMRELDYMKRRGYLFTTTTDVSLALEWIENCMINTNWWIRVQSSMEEGRQLAPTPPKSPLFSSKVENWVLSFISTSFSASAFLAWIRMSTEIVSPEAGDHVLECALHFRKMIHDPKIVILSDDVSMKIKAMAEGMICESADKFRDSLVNPFSDRFLWEKSSPRGLTWSCADDIVLRKKYYHGHFKTLSKSGENSQGLKLILLHNSHFSQPI